MGRFVFSSVLSFWGSKFSAKLLVKGEIADIIATIHIKNILYSPPFYLRYRPWLIWIALITEGNFDFHLLECQHMEQEGSFAMQSGLGFPFIIIQDIPFPHLSFLCWTMFTAAHVFSFTVNFFLAEHLANASLEQEMRDKTSYVLKCLYSSPPVFACCFGWV